MNDAYQALIERFLESNSAEALEWLRAGSGKTFRNLGELEADESIVFVQRLYELGAEKVIAVKIDEYPEGANTGHLLVQLPTSEVARRQLFDFEREHAEANGFEGTRDQGQEFIYLKLD
jgi:hypothetical protein